MKVVGVSYRQKAFRKLAPGEHDGSLVREPENGADRNAVMVIVSGCHIGYIAKELAADFAPFFDSKGKKTIPARVKVIEYAHEDGGAAKTARILDIAGKDPRAAWKRAKWARLEKEEL